MLRGAGSHHTKSASQESKIGRLLPFSSLELGRFYCGHIIENCICHSEEFADRNKANRERVFCHQKVTLPQENFEAVGAAGELSIQGKNTWKLLKSPKPRSYLEIGAWSRGAARTTVGESLLKIVKFQVIKSYKLPQSTVVLT